MRRLIINADDFGITHGVNRAIVEGHQRGIVTSATLMANSPAFSEAVEFARQAQTLSIGCHIVLVDGEPVLPAAPASTLSRDHRFRNGFFEFAQAALSKKLNGEEMAAEATAQVQKLQRVGLQLTHFDTHKHIHLFPQVLRPLLQAARDCGLRAVRNPFAPLRPLAWAHLMRRPRLWTRYSEVQVLRRFAGNFQRAVADAGLRTTDGTFGIVSTGALHEDLFAAIIGCIPEGTWEFVCHPGYCDEDLRQTRTRLKESRECELRVLSSERAREVIRKNDIELISYRDLL